MYPVSWSFSERFNGAIICSITRPFISFNSFFVPHKATSPFRHTISKNATRSISLVVLPLLNKLQKVLRQLYDPFDELTKTSHLAIVSPLVIRSKQNTDFHKSYPEFILKRLRPSSSPLLSLTYFTLNIVHLTCLY